MVELINHDIYILRHILSCFLCSHYIYTDESLNKSQLCSYIHRTYTPIHVEHNSGDSGLKEDLIFSSFHSTTIIFFQEGILLN